MRKKLPSINIQYPFSELIARGKKSVETRTYPIPKKYLDKALYMVETPGPEGKFKARVVGIVIFSRCFKYNSRAAFDADFDRHLVNRQSAFYWKEKTKWGWEISALHVFKKPVVAPRKRGIVFSKEISVSFPQSYLPGP